MNKKWEFFYDQFYLVNRWFFSKRIINIPEVYYKKFTIVQEKKKIFWYKSNSIFLLMMKSRLLVFILNRIQDRRYDSRIVY